MEKKTEVAIGILCDDQGKLLVGRRMRSPQLGKWEMPGGKVEPGETVLEALRREFFEEGGVVLDAIAHWTKIEEELYVLYLFKVSAQTRFMPTIYEEYRYVSADDLSDLDWIASNRGFTGDLRAILKTDQSVISVTYHPRNLGELADCLDEFTRLQSSRDFFRRFACILEAEALTFPNDVVLSKKAAMSYHEGLEIFAFAERPVVLPAFIRTKERG